MKMLKYIPLIMALLLMTVPTAFAEVVYRAKFVATVVSVYDGDTITVNIRGIPDVFGRNLGVRVYGVDTPEMRGPDKIRAVLARDYVKSQCRIGAQAILTNIRRDKYFRIDADIVCNGTDIGKELLRQRMGKPYYGGTK